MIQVGSGFQDMGIITIFIIYLLFRSKPGGLFLDLGGVDLCLDLHLVVLVSTNVINHKIDNKTQFLWQLKTIHTTVNKKFLIF